MTRYAREIDEVPGLSLLPFLWAVEWVLGVTDSPSKKKLDSIVISTKVPKISSFLSLKTFEIKIKTFPPGDYYTEIEDLECLGKKSIKNHITKI